MSLCTAFQGVNSSLPLATSSPLERLPRPAAGARFDSAKHQASNFASKPSVEIDILPDNQPKKEVLLFFRRRPGCFRLHFAGPEETSRTLTLPCWQGRPVVHAPLTEADYPTRVSQIPQVLKMGGGPHAGNNEARNILIWASRRPGKSCGPQRRRSATPAAVPNGLRKLSTHLTANR